VILLAVLLRFCLLRVQHLSLDCGDLLDQRVMLAFMSAVPCAALLWSAALLHAAPLSAAAALVISKLCLERCQVLNHDVLLRFVLCTETYICMRELSNGAGQNADLHLKRPSVACCVLEEH
jgi:hypothetical protein